MDSQWLGRTTDEAMSVLPAHLFDWLVGGSGREESLTAARDAWSHIVLAPDAGIDVSEIDSSTTLLGQHVQAPIGVAPTGFHGLLHPSGESGTAQACAENGLLFTLSSRASLRFEESVIPGAPWWFQAYVVHDRGVTADQVARAVALGATAIVLTVDTPVLPARRRSRDGGLVDAATMLRNAPEGTPLAALEQSPTVTTRDVQWLAQLSGLPIVVKGVLRPDTALRFVDAGARAIWVSNHGGRQLDGAVAPAKALSTIVTAVPEDIEVYVDGGVRSGIDVLRAVALGARCAFVGRAPMLGLAAGGRQGAADVLFRLRAEFSQAMQLCGRTTVDLIGPDLIWHDGTRRH